MMLSQNTKELVNIENDVHHCLYGVRMCSDSLGDWYLSYSSLIPKHLSLRLLTCHYDYFGTMVRWYVWWRIFAF